MARGGRKTGLQKAAEAPGQMRLGKLLMVLAKGQDELMLPLQETREITRPLSVGTHASHSESVPTMVRCTSLHAGRSTAEVVTCSSQEVDSGTCGPSPNLIVRRSPGRDTCSQTTPLPSCGTVETACVLTCSLVGEARIFEETVEAVGEACSTSESPFETRENPNEHTVPEGSTASGEAWSTCGFGAPSTPERIHPPSHLGVSGTFTGCLDPSSEVLGERRMTDCDENRTLCSEPALQAPRTPKRARPLVDWHGPGTPTRCTEPAPQAPSTPDRVRPAADWNVPSTPTRCSETAFDAMSTSKKARTDEAVVWTPRARRPLCRNNTREKECMPAHIARRPGRFQSSIDGDTSKCSLEGSRKSDTPVALPPSSSFSAGTCAPQVSTPCKTPLEGELPPVDADVVDPCPRTPPWARTSRRSRSRTPKWARTRSYSHATSQRAHSQTPTVSARKTRVSSPSPDITLPLKLDFGSEVDLSAESGGTDSSPPMIRSLLAPLARGPTTRDGPGTARSGQVTPLRPADRTFRQVTPRWQKRGNLEQEMLTLERQMAMPSSRR